MLMLTKVPFFKEVIISSFECDECGYRDNSIQSGSRIQDKGAKYTVTIATSRVSHQSENRTEMNQSIPSFMFLNYMIMFFLQHHLYM